MSDRDLDPECIARAAAGDADALEALLQAVEPELRAGIHVPPLWRRSLEPEDVLQVSFLEAFLRMSSLQDCTPAGFRAWMRRIVDNNLTDAIRALERDKRPDARARVTHASGGESARTLFAALSGGASTPTRLLSAQEEVARLHEAIGKLPESYQRVVREVELGERPVAEVAAEMGRSAGRIHMVRSRARQRLRELLED